MYKMSHREQFATQALIADATMTKPKPTAEERRARLLVTYNKYNEAHRAERREHNRSYSKLDHVKARRRELYRQKRNVKASADEPSNPPRSSDQPIDAQL